MSFKSSYFPIFLDISKRKVLVIGGGKIAKDKIEKLLEFEADIRVISKEFKDETLKLLETSSIPYIKKEYQETDLDGIDIVISAVDNLDLQRVIYQDSRGKNILINSVDSKEYCDFVFGSFIKEGDMIIAISTSGVAPAVSKYLKRFLKKALPENLSEFLRKIKQTRESMPKGRERMELLDDMAKSFFKES